MNIAWPTCIEAEYTSGLLPAYYITCLESSCHTRWPYSQSALPTRIFDFRAMTDGGQETELCSSAQMQLVQELKNEVDVLKAANATLLSDLREIKGCVWPG